MKRDEWVLLVVWIALSVVGEIWAFTADFFPTSAAEEAVHLDAAFRQLMILGMPVFTFVVVMMGYAIWRFRVDDDDVEQSGPPIYEHRTFSLAWLAVTGILAAVLFYNPGLTGWFFVNRDNSEDLVVQVEGAQWHWHVTYPEYDLSYKSAPASWQTMENKTVLALPVDRRVKFEITSADVIHSFWIPAFRIKQDAVPGITTQFYVTPNRTGTFADSMDFRVQCAELCGTGHPNMNMRVSIMEPAAFDEWVAQMNGGGMEEMQMGEEEQTDDSGMNMEEDEHSDGDEH